MSKLSDKYIAGFLDSDGCVMPTWSKVDRKDSKPELKRMYVELAFTQMTCQDEVLFKIQESIGGRISIIERPFGKVTELKLFGSKAIPILDRIKKHVVIKRHYLNVLLDIHGSICNLIETKKYLKEQRKIRSLPLPNYPSRKWLAGYFDGDGSICTNIPKDRNAVNISGSIVSSDYDSEGLEIIHKSFGGSLKYPDKNRTHLRRLHIHLSPSKAKHFLGYFAKHSIVKRDQIYFILGCAEMGHYRDGKNIKQALKQLKSQPHRLNESEVDVSKYIAEIKDIQQCFNRFKT